MKTATKKKTKTGSSKGGEKVATNKDSNELADSFQVLKQHLSNLEREQKAVRAELNKKRKNRAQKLQEIRETRARNADSMKRLDSGLKTTLNLSRQQQKYLRAMRKVQKQNETALNRIASRLDGLETMLNQRPVPVVELKSELMTMLGELQQIRQRREKVEENFSSAE